MARTRAGHMKRPTRGSTTLKLKRHLRATLHANLDENLDSPSDVLRGRSRLEEFVARAKAGGVTFTINVHVGGKNDRDDGPSEPAPTPTPSDRVEEEAAPVA